MEHADLKFWPDGQASPGKRPRRAIQRFNLDASLRFTTWVDHVERISLWRLIEFCVTLPLAALAAVRPLRQSNLGAPRSTQDHTILLPSTDFFFFEKQIALIDLITYHSLPQPPPKPGWSV
jgi:hypothetical protein